MLVLYRGSQYLHRRYSIHDTVGTQENGEAEQPRMLGVREGLTQGLQQVQGVSGLHPLGEVHSRIIKGQRGLG